MKNLQSFHLTSWAKAPPQYVLYQKKNLQTSCIDSHMYCIVDEESTMEENTAL